MSKRSLKWNADARTYAAIGSLVIGIAVLVVYQPAMSVGFLGDDWYFLGKNATLNLGSYLAFYFDPAKQVFWYRPLYGIWLLIEYSFFRSSPAGYHFGQIILHLANCLLLFAVVLRVSKRWRLAWLGSMLYATLPIYGSAVFWIAVQDPLSMTFFLTAVFFWVIYLENGNRRSYILSLCTFMLTLLAKETGCYLPVTLFLIDLLLFKSKINAAEWFRRYVVFGLVLLVYLAVALSVQARGYFTTQQGYGFGPQIISNALQAGQWLLFPMGTDQPIGFLWLATGSVLLGLALVKRNHGIPNNIVLFLGIETGLTIAPTLGFLAPMFEPRYLYTTGMVAAISSALLFESALARYAEIHVWLQVMLGATLVLLVFAHSTDIFAKASATAEMSRQFRVPLHDIYQEHPYFPPDTYLYFADGCTLRIMSGALALKYGANVTAMCPDVGWGGVDTSGVTENQFAGLRNHQNAFVYYYDESNRRHEVVVSPTAPTTSSIAFPAEFQATIRLLGYEITSSTLKHGDSLILFLYWKAKGFIDKDYTVFVHLVDESGQVVAGEDSQPRNGIAPTTSWKQNTLVVDPQILAISSDIPFGRNYHLDVGLYYLPTMKRVGIIDSTGRLISDTLTIQPFSVVE